jgi:putative intracellular protease/amidase
MDAQPAAEEEQKNNSNSNNDNESASQQINILMVVSSFTEMPPTQQQQTENVTPPKTGWYIPEVAHPWAKFTAKGYNMVFVSPKGGAAFADVGSLAGYAEDGVCQKFKTECMTEDGTAVNTVQITDASINVSDFQVIFYAGGHGVMWDFPDCEAQSNAAVAIYESGGIVSAVCHGPAALVNIKLSNGEFLIANKMVSGFTNDEEDAVQKSEVMPFMLETVMKERGARFVSCSNWASNVITDQRLITGQNPASAEGCADAIIAHFEK